MQSFSNISALPVRLLQAHEDGRVVFFCGAGISMPMLPGFSCLVKRLYNKLKGELTPSQKKELKEGLKEELNAGRPDIAFGLLEAAFDGDRTKVRKTLANIVNSRTKPDKNIIAHECLLKLSKNRKDESTRLVTTNFDRLFEETIKDQSPQIKRFYAPFLPIPKKQWNGLVYLHGLLPKGPAQSKLELDQLVVSSGDFGLAYLTERWASRFVSELFRNYVVCFVGYSLNDPVLRYMTDAIAADHQRGEATQKMFAFGSYAEEEKEKQRKKWENKNVTPILYLKENQHAHLREILKDWCVTGQDDVRVKRRIVAKCATAPPSGSTEEEGFVSQVLWALSEPSGQTAEYFADLYPAPSLKWLKPLCEEHYNRTGLERSGIPTSDNFMIRGKFSLLLSPSKWDEVTQQLARWLTRHLNNPKLLLQMANLGNSLHHNLVAQIKSRLDELSKLKCDGNATKLERTLSDIPEEIAFSLTQMQTLWRLLLTGRVSPGSRGAQYLAFTHWQARFKRYGLTTTLRLGLRELLTPRVSLWPAIGNADSEPRRVKDLVGWEIIMFEHEVIYGLKELTKDECWEAESPKLLTEFSTLLHEVLDLTRELGSENDRTIPLSALSPSISERKLNIGLNDWTPLVNLTCNAWLFTAKQSPERARCAAEEWSQEPYPLFQRLAFFAAAQGKTIPSSQGLKWLLADEHRWLWDAQTIWETIRLLGALTPQLTKDEIAELEKAILNGPPSDTPENHIDHKHQTNSADSNIWLRLVEIDQAGATLSEDGRKKLAELSDKHPDWKPAKDESDEFSSSSLISLVDGHGLVPTPRSRRELTKWLKHHPAGLTDDWRRRCRDDFATAADALCALAKEGIWPADRWSAALQAWSEEKLTERSWRYMAPVLAKVPDKHLQHFALEFSRWLRTIAKPFVGEEGFFLELCERVLKLKYEEGAGSYFVPRNHGRPGGNDFLACAMNHPVGCATDALLNWWYRKTPKDGQGLPGELKHIFTMLCDRSFNKFRHGRVFLAVNLISLFRVDRDWTTKHLLPLFDWQTSETEACAAWQGFLWSPRHYDHLMEVLKTDFLETASHYEALAQYGKQYASLLTYAALNRGDTFGTKELAAATRALPKDGLGHAAQELARMTEGTEADKRQDNYWKNRVAPYIRKVWPKKQEKISLEVTNNLGRVCIAAQEAFPEAFELLKPWLQPTADSTQDCDFHHDNLVQQLNKTKICSKFPEQALDFLDLVTPKQPRWIPKELKACLKAIHISKPELETDAKYQRLMVTVRQREAD